MVVEKPKLSSKGELRVNPSTKAAAPIFGVSDLNAHEALGQSLLPSDSNQGEFHPRGSKSSKDRCKVKTAASALKTLTTPCNR